MVTNGFSGVKFDPEHGWVVPPGTVHPAGKGKALARFRVFPSEITEAHILPFIPEAARIDQQSDLRLSSFAKVLSDAATIHAVTTALMETESWDFTAVYYDAVDHFSHAFMPYHPPKLDWVPEEDFEMYKGVVRGAYRFHDMMLERLLQLAGPETTVILCSDHGFESGARRPRGTPREPAGPAIWHRQYGIFVMAGPGIKRDERIYGASLIDITPTVLQLFDLPIGEDMDGRPLLEAFEKPPAVEKISSWEKRAGEAGMHPAGQAMDANQAQELMQQFAALGYIENPGASKIEQEESADIEGKYNLARTFLWKNEPERARPLLEGIVRRRPWEDRFLMLLATCYFRADYLAQAERLLALIADAAGSRDVSTELLRAKLKFARADWSGGLEALLEVEAFNPSVPEIYIQIGAAYSHLFQLDRAEQAYRKAVTLDENSVLGWQGLSTVYRKKGMNQETADAALRGVGLLHRLPIAHFNLGVALARSGDAERAIVAFETALRFQPEMVNAHRYLATLYREKNAEKAALAPTGGKSNHSRASATRASGRSSARAVLRSAGNRASSGAISNAVKKPSRPDPAAKTLGENLCSGLRSAAFGHLSDDADARSRRTAAPDGSGTRCRCR